MCLAIFERTSQSIQVPIHPSQFAMFEATVCLAMLVRRFRFALATPPEEVGLTTGATIHTRNGLKMTVERRATAGEGGKVKAQAASSA